MNIRSYNLKPAEVKAEEPTSELAISSEVLDKYGKELNEAQWPFTVYESAT
jgi:hypothetical protein